MKIKDYIKVRTIFEVTQDEDKIVKQLLNINKEATLKDSLKLTQEYLATIKKMPDTLIQTFKIGGVEYGFIPDLENITTAEYLDLDAYQNDTSHINRVMAILYRPIVRKYKGTYVIEDYEGSDKYKDIMLEVDAKVYLSAISFFFHLLGLLLEGSSIYLKEKMQRMEKKKRTKVNL